MITYAIEYAGRWCASSGRMEEDATIELLTRLSLAWLPHSFMAGQTTEKPAMVRMLQNASDKNKAEAMWPEREGGVQVNYSKI